MSASEQDRSAPTVLNVPNQITALRLVLAIILFVLIGVAQGIHPDKTTLRAQLFFSAMIVFLIAAATDWIDGFWARRYGQVTVVGRIFDPFVDKVIICGTFIFLVASAPESQIVAWMAVVVVGRELLVTALRGFFEREGTDFSAQMAGKLKMVFQCAAAAGSLFVLTYTDTANSPAPEWLRYTVLALIWVAVISTIYSGMGYVVAALKLLRGG